MKYTCLLLAILALSACQPSKTKDYAAISGTILHPNSDSIEVYNKDYSKTIALDSNGAFSDTLHIVPGIYYLSDGIESTKIFLKEGYDIALTIDTELFDETLSYAGNGSENSNFLAEEYLMEEKLFDIDIDDHDSNSLKEKMAEIERQLNEFVDAKTDLDTMVTHHAKKGIRSSIEGYSNYLGDMITLRENFPKGTPSPLFENYENHAGGTTSLTDLKGKFVYIDVWATWCGPCKAEIPYLKEVEEQFHDKNITFVSISIDREKDHEKWVSMVKEKALGGIQLFADNDWSSQFVKDYYINGIPRFILLDPDGNVLSPDAPRPSQDKLKTLLNDLLAAGD
ncbi:MAG: TlpA disulfide reductase family protein [Flavobacteriaceae bacterium]